MTDRHDTDPLERGLRRTLSTRADDAPDAHALTERLLAAGEQRRVRRPWTAFGTPLLAAACVAAIVGIVLATVQPGHTDHGPDSSYSLPVPATSAMTPAPSARSSAVSPTSSATRSTPALRNVRIVDLTFTSANSGWALASADCLTGSGRCTALLRSTDGSTWAGRADTPFDVSGVSAGCPAAKCVTNIRFANDSVGYAYGPDALFLTRDGAKHWTPLSGGADALETLNGNVLRVTHAGSCPPGCTYTVQTAAVGSPVWTTRSLPGQRSGGVSVQLVRTGHTAYVASLGNIAGGAPAPATVWTSDDDGVSWTNHGELCDVARGPGPHLEIDTVALSPASDGSVAFACRIRSTGGVLVATSTSGEDLTVNATGIPGTRTDGNSALPFLAAASKTTFVAGVSRLYRSTDAGMQWSVRSAVDVSAGVTFAGFQSATVGRLVTDGGRTIWTTRDAGATWTRVNP